MLFLIFCPDGGPHRRRPWDGEREARAGRERLRPRERYRSAFGDGPPFTVGFAPAGRPTRPGRSAGQRTRRTPQGQELAGANYGQQVVQVLGLAGDGRCEEDVEPLLLEVEDVLLRQALAFGCEEWAGVTAQEIHRQVATVAALPGEAAGFMFECSVEQLRRLRLVCKRGAMSDALEVCGRYGVDVGGWDGRG